MKHLRKYNESYKEPIDVSDDVEKFRRMFKGVIAEDGWVGVALKRLEDDNPTMTDDWSVWGIYRTVNGRRMNYSGYVRAISKDHAKLKYAVNRKEINYFVDYDAEELSQDDIDGIIDSLEYEIHLIKNPI
jgi:hypothetical protein